MDQPNSMVHSTTKQNSSKQKPSACHTAKDRVIGSLLANTSCTDIKAVFNSYDVNKSSTINITTLASSEHQRSHLLATIEYLKKSFTANQHSSLLKIISHPKQSNQRNKHQFATDIVTFVEQLLPIDCLKCGINYHPHNQNETDSQIECIKCKRPSHNGCYNDSNIDIEDGIVMMCSVCLKILRPCKEIVNVTQSPTTSTDHDEEEHIEPIAPVKNKEPNNIIPIITVTDDNDKDKENDVNNEEIEPQLIQLSQVDANAKGDELQQISQSKQHTSPTQTIAANTSSKTTDKPAICPLLLKKECPYGISGKDCPNYHPNWCFKYQSYGPEGCRNKKCKFYHPKICENSLKIKVCLNKNCTDVHLKGTSRTLNHHNQRTRRYHSNADKSNNESRGTDTFQENKRSDNSQSMTHNPPSSYRRSDHNDNTRQNPPSSYRRPLHSKNGSNNDSKHPSNYPQKKIDTVPPTTEKPSQSTKSNLPVCSNSTNSTSKNSDAPNNEPIIEDTNNQKKDDHTSQFFQYLEQVKSELTNHIEIQLTRNLNMFHIRSQIPQMNIQSQIPQMNIQSQIPQMNPQYCSPYIPQANTFPNIPNMYHHQNTL